MRQQDVVSRIPFIIATCPVRWRFLRTPPQSGALNMALDDALMARAARTGESVFRVYSWSEPTLSFGRHQKAAGIYDEIRLATEGIEVVRRPTGGRALLHDREVTYSVTAPATSAASLGDDYLAINAILVTALRTLGVHAHQADSIGRSMRPGVAPCFAEPAHGELVVDGRKLVGSAQWRDAGGLLQHGSILVDDDQSRIPSLMCEPVAPPPAPATLRDILGTPPSFDAVADAMLDAVRTGLDADVSEVALDAELKRATDERVAHYRDHAWTWRR